MRAGFKKQSALVVPLRRGGKQEGERDHEVQHVEPHAEEAELLRDAARQQEPRADDDGGPEAPEVALRGDGDRKAAAIDTLELRIADADARRDAAEARAAEAERLMKEEAQRADRLAEAAKDADAGLAQQLEAETARREEAEAAAAREKPTRAKALHAYHTLLYT